MPSSLSLGRVLLACWVAALVVICASRAARRRCWYSRKSRDIGCRKLGRAAKASSDAIERSRQPPNSLLKNGEVVAAAFLADLSSRWQVQVDAAAIEIAELLGGLHPSRVWCDSSRSRCAAAGWGSQACRSDLWAGSRCRRRRARPSGVRKTVIGQPPLPVSACTASMYSASMSGRSSRSTLILTKFSFIRRAMSSFSKDSSLIRWHQWQLNTRIACYYWFIFSLGFCQRFLTPRIPIDRIMGML